MELVVIKEVGGQTYPVSSFYLIINGDMVLQEFDTELEALMHYVRVVIGDTLIFRVTGEQM